MRQKSLSDNTLEHVPLKDTNTVASKMKDAEKAGICGRMRERINSEFSPKPGMWLIFQSLLEFFILAAAWTSRTRNQQSTEMNRDDSMILTSN